MIQIFSDSNKIYSVDMMFSYIAKFKPRISPIPLTELTHNLDYTCWGDPEMNIRFSPNDVLANPDKYPDNTRRIHLADMRYPICLTSDYNIIDGVHRLCKAKSENKRTIKAYVFDKALMRKFLIDKNGDWVSVRNMKIYDYITLFDKRFNI